jgi:septal ring factor EnvC (AmiA/AmiB activator)
MNRAEQQYTGSLEAAISRGERKVADLEAQIEDLESEIATRNKRIAELMDTRIDMAAAAADYNRARAEVPEWCQRFVRKVYDSVRVGEYGGFRIDKSGIAGACHMLTETRLRACGIEIP